MNLGQRKRSLSIICILSLLASLSLAGCSDRPSKDEIARILALTDPVIEETLSSAYGFTPGKDYLSSGTVGYSRMAEYTFEVNGSRHTASVDPYSPELITYTDYYSKEFSDLFKGKILGGIDDLNLFSGCEYDLNFFSFWDSTPEEHNPRYSGGFMFPTFVTPDNLDEYLTSSGASPLSINIELYYYGPADKKVSEEKVRQIWDDFYPTNYGCMSINHYSTKRTGVFDCLLEEYTFYPHSSSWYNIEYSYYDLTDGVTLRCISGKDNFEYSVDNNILHLKVDSNYEHRLHISHNRFSEGDKYYQYYTDSSGKTTKSTQTWFNDNMHLNGEYEIPLR